VRFNWCEFISFRSQLNGGVTFSSRLALLKCQDAVLDFAPLCESKAIIINIMEASLSRHLPDKSGLAITTSQPQPTELAN
jgi:hypothetical protein